MKPLTSDLKTQLDRFIDQLSYGSHPEELYQPIKYIMTLGGKRMRPLLCLLSYRLFRTDPEEIFAQAAGIEVFHNFTLMHDDIMDQAPLRRGMKTVHLEWNENVAILSGDVMFVKAYELLMETKDEKLRELIRQFNISAAQVCEGQQLDMNLEKRSMVSIEEYLEMIRLKTAVLIGFSMWTGAYLADAGLTRAGQLYEAGVNLGIGFQLTDDLLDVFAPDEKFGKRIGGDILAQKKTFLFISALEQCAPDQRAELEKLYSGNEDSTENKVQKVKALFEDLQVEKKTRERIRTYFDLGISGLESLDIPIEEKAPLMTYINSLVNREI